MDLFKSNQRAYQTDMEYIKECVTDAIYSGYTDTTVIVSTATLHQVVKTLEDKGYTVSISDCRPDAKVITIQWGKQRDKKKTIEYKAVYFDCTDGIEFEGQLNNCFKNGLNFVQCISTGNVDKGINAVIVFRVPEDRKEGE